MLEVKFTLEDLVKEAQRGDKSLAEIREKKKIDEAPNYQVDKDGVIWFKDLLLVPNQKDIKDLLMQEAHESAYSIHPGST